MKWRTLGDTSLETFRAMLPENSEIVKRGEVEAVYYSGSPHTRLLLGMLKAESSFATHFNAVPAVQKNPLNLRVRGQAQFQWFSSIAACVEEWKDRITSPTYAYKDTVSVEGLVSVYAPGHDGNNENWYVNTIKDVVGRAAPLVKQEVKSVSIPTKPLVEIAITPHGKNRPALEMPSPSFITVHEVGNQKPGADENMHRNFVHGGGGENNVSFHFVGGPTKIIQLLPLDEVGWHASDGYYGTGNRDSIAVETIQIGDFDKTLWNIAWLIAEIANNPSRFFSNKPRQWDMSLQRIKQHFDWAPDKKNCPEFIRNRGLWPELMRRVDLWDSLAKVPVQPAPEPEPEKPKHEIPAGETFESLRRYYGSAVNPVTGEVETFDLAAAPSQVWLANGKKTGLWPKLREIVRRGNGDVRYTWEGGFHWTRKAA